MEHKKRQQEALRCYRPTHKQWLFHKSTASERIVRGGKRSGKTVCAGIEFASAVTGIPILNPWGNPCKRHYPKRDMLAWVIGWDLAHIGQTVYRVLFESGYIRILPKKDGSWETWNPANPDHAARQAEAIPAGSMIPDRLIIGGSWSWENKAEHVFKTVEVRNPWGTTKICAFPSTAIQAKQGDAVDLIWIDEDVRFPQHVSEWQDRLGDRGGRLIWSAWPHGANDALVEMSERAAEQRDMDEPDVFEVVLRFSDNPFISEEDKRKQVGRMRSEEDRRSRDYGEFLLDTFTMYDFVPQRHGVYKITENTPHLIQYAGELLNDIYSQNSEFPDDWTRYIAIDPSHTRTACLFGVVPPPMFKGIPLGRTLIIENELVVKRAGAEELAKAMSPFMRRRYEAFIMDHNMGRQTRVGSSTGTTTYTLYEDAFRRAGYRSRLTKSGFFPGNNSVTSRTMEVRTMMLPDQNGIIKLRLAMDKTPATQREFMTYRKKMVMDQVLDEPANSRIHDCMNALEYLVSYIYCSPEPYIEPGKYSKGSPAFRRARQLLSKWKGESANFCHVGPGELK